MAKSQAEYVQEIMAGPDGAPISEVKCGFRESEYAEPCGCLIPIAHASNVRLSVLVHLKKLVRTITLRDIEKVSGFLCQEHIALLKKAGVVPELVLTTKQIDDLASRRRNDELRNEEQAATTAEHQAKLAAARAFAAAAFGPKQRVVKRNGRNGRVPVAATV